MADDRASQLRQLVTATNDLQERLRNAVEKLENESSGGSSSSTANLSTTSHNSSRRASSRDQSSDEPCSSRSLGQCGIRRTVGTNFWSPASILGKRQPSPHNPKKKGKNKPPSWTHTFVCLASVNQDTIPDQDERACLQIADLGERKVQLALDSNATDIYDGILEIYPKLRNCGGYELLRSLGKGSKFLEVIPVPPSGYTTAYLRAVVHNARIFVRPVQQNISLPDTAAIETIENNDVPKEECFFCKEKICVSGLRKHLESCSGRNDSVSLEELPDNEKANIDQRDLANAPHSRMYSDDPFIEISSSESTSDAESSNGQETNQLNFEPVKNDEPDGGVRTISDLVRNLSKSLEETETFDMIVRRCNVLKDALRRMENALFDPRKALNVDFVGELGADGGGLTREFFRLVKYDASQYLEVTGCFKRNSIAFQDNVYLKVGILAGMALTHGGGSFAVLSQSVFKFVCGVNLTDLTPKISEVPCIATRMFLETVSTCSELHQLKQLVTDNMDLLIESGFTKPLITLDLADKEQIIKTVVLHYVLISSLAELSQFRDGMYKIDGLKQGLAVYSELLEPFYCINAEECLTADQLRKLFNVIMFSEVGSNRRISEEATYMFFLNFLDDCEKGVDSDSIELKNILSFFTGADHVPPYGFHSATLRFGPDDIYPTASTCSIELSLPLKHAEYLDFKKHMILALNMHGGFGLA